MRGLIEEKTSRIVEVIISSVKPHQLMLGKILVIALVGLTQFLLWIVLTLAATGIVKTFFTGEIAAGAGNPAVEVLNALGTINIPLILVCFIFYFLGGYRSEEHTSELQSLMRISYAVFCLKKKKIYNNSTQNPTISFNYNH